MLQVRSDLTAGSIAGGEPLDAGNITPVPNVAPTLPKLPGAFSATASPALVQ